MSEHTARCRWEDCPHGAKCVHAVPPTQAPAAPEGETDANGLTAGEIAMLGDGVAHTTEALCWTPSCAGSLPWAVERIVAERVRVVEGEREEWRARALSNAEQCDRNWAEACLAVSRAESAEAALAKVQEELDEHRAHYVDPAAYAELRAGVEALADEWDACDEHGNPLREGSLGEAADDLRALLGGAS